MTLTQVDFDIIMKRLDKFEEDLKKLENEVKVLNACVDTQLKNKYYPNTCYGGVALLDAVGSTSGKLSLETTPYALVKGSLLDSGSIQQWCVATDKDDVEE